MKIAWTLQNSNVYHIIGVIWWIAWRYMKEASLHVYVEWCLHSLSFIRLFKKNSFSLFFKAFLYQHFSCFFSQQLPTYRTECLISSHSVLKDRINTLFLSMVKCFLSTNLVTKRGRWGTVSGNPGANVP